MQVRVVQLIAAFSYLGAACSSPATVVVAPPTTADLGLLLVFQGNGFRRALGPVQSTAALRVTVNEDEQLFFAAFSGASLLRVAAQIDLDRLDEVSVSDAQEDCPEGRLDGDQLSLQPPSDGQFFLYDGQSQTFVEAAEAPSLSGLSLRGPGRSLVCPQTPSRLAAFGSSADLGLGRVLSSYAVEALNRDLVIAYGRAHIIVLPRGADPIAYALEDLRTTGAGPAALSVVRAEATSDPGKFRFVAIGFDPDEARTAGFVLEGIVDASGLTVSNAYEGDHDLRDVLLESDGGDVVVGNRIIHRMQAGVVLDQRDLPAGVDLRTVSRGRSSQEPHIAAGGNGVVLAGDLLGAYDEYAILRDELFIDSSITRIIHAGPPGATDTVFVTISRGAFRWRDDGVFVDYSVPVERELALCRGFSNSCEGTRLGLKIWGSVAMADGRLFVVPSACTAAAIYDVAERCSTTIRADDGPIDLTEEDGFVAASHRDGLTVIATPREVFELVP